jgi:3-oxoacyl-(acyl-carrier-protein) synthase III
MSSNEFVVTVPMPFTGESIVDGVLVNWLVAEGDQVKKGQHVAEIETEKSVWEFESPCDGVVVAFKAQPGDVVDVQAPLFEITTADENMRHLAFGAPAESKPTEDAVADRVAGAETVRISPRVKKLLRDAGVGEDQWAEIVRKNGGRVEAEQIELYLAGRKSASKGAPSARACYIAGLGTYTPERIVANDHFAGHFDDIDESYIEKVTGIRERRWANGESTSDMAVEAARAALGRSGVRADEIEMLILATTTADMPLPASACIVASKLGCGDIAAFDIQAACSGWLYALSIGRNYIQSGACSRVLVIAAEMMSVFTDITDRATGFLFGDGAGAAVLGTDPSGHRLSNVVMRTDTEGYDIIYRKGGGSSMPFRAMQSPKDEYWVMDGGRMFRSAVTGFSDVIVKAIEKEGLSLDEITWFVPHQANQRILKTVAHRLKADPDRFFSNIHRLGNTSAASIPLALEDLQSQEELSKGDRILLCAVGAGLTSAACIIEW